MRFRTTLEQTGTTATGVRVPDEMVAQLDGGRRPAVSVTINGFTYRSTITPMHGENWLSVSGENRAATGIKAGDEIEVDLALDTAPREVDVPADFQAALAGAPRALATFDALSYSNRLWHVLQVTGAKTDETRQRRIAKSVAALSEGRPR